MHGLEVQATPLEGLLVLTPQLFADKRGYFLETYNEKDASSVGINTLFVQDNESRSCRGVLRGLHMQRTQPQAKLVRVVSGEVFDVAVDARVGSPTFGSWYGLTLSGSNKKQLYIPEGFLHGFLVLSEEAVFSYKCSRYYDPDDEVGVLYNDPDLAIEWPLSGIGTLLVSEKDKVNKSFYDFRCFLGEH